VTFQFEATKTREEEGGGRVSMKGVVLSLFVWEIRRRGEKKRSGGKREGENPYFLQKYAIVREK